MHGSSPLIPSRRAVLCTGVAVFASALYLNALANPFVYDDFRVIVENTSIVDLGDLRAIVILEPTRPLVNLTYALDRAIWGLNPVGYHLTNLLLHVANVILLFVLAGRLAEDRARSGLSFTTKNRDVVSVSAAAAFAAHPLLSQAVGYVAARPELLCGVFFLSGLLAARRWLLGGGAVWWVTTVAAWILSIISKEPGGMFPFVLLLYERLILRPPDALRTRARWRLHGVLIGLSLAAILARVLVLAVVQYPGEVAFEWRFAAMQVDVILRYLGLLVAPQGQTIFHAVPLTRLDDPRTWLSITGLALLVVSAIWLRRRAATLALGLGWFLLLLLPSTVLVLLDRGEPMAEHRVYVASMGLFLTMGTVIGGFVRVLEHRRLGLRLVAHAVVIVFIAGLAVRTVIRNLIWSDPVMLWAESVGQAPDHWFPNMLLGEALYAAGRRDEAAAVFRRVIALRPGETAAYQKLALVLAETGRYDEAKAEFSRLDERDPRSPVVTNGIGAIALLEGDRERARALFVESIARDPTNIVARQALAAMAEEPPGDYSEALRLCREIQQLAPRTPGNDDCIRRNQARLGQ
jgi:tetratricopeptide (TPR) repeat protein